MHCSIMPTAAMEPLKGEYGVAMEQKARKKWCVSAKW